MKNFIGTIGLLCLSSMVIIEEPAIAAISGIVSLVLLMLVTTMKETNEK